MANGKVTESTDVFALGVTLYQFFLGLEKSPFADNKSLAISIKIQNEQLPSLGISHKEYFQH